MSFLLGAACGLVVTSLVALIIIFWWLRKREKESLTWGSERGITKIRYISEVLYYAFEASPTAIAVVDWREEVVIANPRAEALGIVEERSLKKNIWAVVEQVFSDQEPQRLSLPGPPTGRAEKPILSVSCLVQQLTVQDGRYVVIYASDNSESVRMESARRDFVANVSHELKTPVGAMSLLVETMLEAKEDVDAVDYFGQKLLGESHRLNTMITELISLSKLQGAESLPELEDVNIDTVIKEAIQRCSLQAENAGITIISDKATNTVVRGDHNLLVTAVTNLLSNAINYSPDATDVSISRQIHGDTLHLKVTDRGIGIALEDQSRVFERFFRVDKARSRATGGTGLGLAIVKHVAANHGGRVSLWSRKGTGSTFTLELPIYSPIDNGEEAPGDIKNWEKKVAEKTEEKTHPTRQHFDNLHGERGEREEKEYSR